jgi:ChaB
VPKCSRHSLPSASELPGTLKRSPEEAQDTFTRALTSAVQASGEGDQALRAAYAELKRTFERRGDHWIPEQAPSPGVSAPGEVKSGRRGIRKTPTRTRQRPNGFQEHVRFALSHGSYLDVQHPDPLR